MIVSALPIIEGILSFDVTFSCAGVHQAHGYIYNGKQHGIIKIDILFGGAFNVKITSVRYNSKQCKLPVFDEFNINGRLLLKKAICCNCREGIRNEVVERAVS